MSIHARCVVTIISSVFLSGCVSSGLWKSKDQTFAKADARNPVAKIVCLWQPAEGKGLDDKPTRGFAGQILFLTRNSPTPVEVDGDVQVFLFEDQRIIDKQTKPMHQINFVGGAWATHLHKTAWGPTYQIFIPYSRPGSHLANCALRVHLQPKAGPNVTSDVAKITLPGRPDEIQVVRQDAHHLPSTSSADRFDENTRNHGRSVNQPNGFQSFTVPQ